MRKQATLFLSHAHADAALALTFAEWLEQAFDPPVRVTCTSRPTDRIDSRVVTSALVERMQQSDVALASVSHVSEHRITLGILRNGSRSRLTHYIHTLSYRQL